MKKIFSLALILVAVQFALTSCSDDKDLPNVDFSAEITGATVDQNTGIIYVVQGDTINIESISVKNVDSDKEAAITGAEYFWDYNFIGNSPFAPYGIKIAINDQMPAGAHALTIRMGIAAVDKAPAVGVVNYEVQVVPDESDIPSTAAVQPTVKTLEIQN